MGLAFQQFIEPVRLVRGRSHRHQGTTAGGRQCAHFGKQRRIVRQLQFHLLLNDDRILDFRICVLTIRRVRAILVLRKRYLIRFLGIEFLLQPGLYHRKGRRRNQAEQHRQQHRHACCRQHLLPAQRFFLDFFTNKRKFLQIFCFLLFIHTNTSVFNLQVCTYFIIRYNKKIVNTFLSGGHRLSGRRIYE